MTRREFDRAVANATGESLREIRRRGFGPALQPVLDFEAYECERSPQLVDWDELSADRPSLFP